MRPGNSAVLNNLGLTLIDQEKLPEAIAAFNKAIEIDPKHAIAYSNLGFTLDKQGRLNEAIVSIRKAIEIDPKYAHDHNRLGSCLAHRGSWTRPSPAYRKAIELDPKVRRCPLQPRHCPEGAGESWTRPSPATARPSNSTRNSPTPTATSAMPCMPRRTLDEAIACLPQGHRTRSEIRQQPTSTSATS